MHEEKESIALVDALIELELAKSKREARELIGGNAITINGDKVSDLDFVVRKEHAFGGKYTIIRKGKKKYAVIRHL